MECPACGKEKGIFKKTVKPGQLCADCETKAKPCMALVEKGGLLLVCEQCSSFGVLAKNEATESAILEVRKKANVPNGFLLVKMKICPNCEAKNGDSGSENIPEANPS